MKRRRQLEPLAAYLARGGTITRLAPVSGEPSEVIARVKAKGMSWDEWHQSHTRRHMTKTIGRRGR